ncbi:DUF2079 domain-containing protein [Catenuloplanes sp. NPDC051500]|uniref:DUF2079 domain-containing protein n=1 Tax=Catenuloplanes sp. NPDC051500 TaxID=3363959 RepID=UPI0037B3C890
MSITPHGAVTIPRSSEDGAGPGRSGRWAPYPLALLVFIAFGTLAIGRHARFQTGGYDLGIFEQAIRGYAHLGPPIAALKGPGFNLLGDHFHPILIVIAPFYRVFPSPLTILLFQAALIAVSVIPVARLAIATAGVAGGMGIGVAYGLSWGFQSAVDFDFHEVAFAVPLVAFSLVAIVEKRWRSAVLWALPLVLVKEDLPATVAAIGLVIALRGQRRTGIALIGFAVAAGVAIVAFIIPAFNPQHVYAYSVNKYPTDQGPLARMFTPVAKWRTLFWIVLPTAFLAPISSLFLVAVPTLLWRFWSTNPLYWEMGFQYNAILMPIVFVAFVESMSTLTFFTRDARRKLAVSIAAAALTVVYTYASPWALNSLLDGNNWRLSAEVKAAKELLEKIPSGATVAADNHFAAQLTSRCTVYFFPDHPGDGTDPEWVVYGTPLDVSMASAEVIEAELNSVKDRYTVVASNSSGVLLRLRRT